ncbi:hypothetical protein Q8F57_033165 [Paraburkholderia terrae]|uniref:hypothetical protein n=1 Tax=Paraburkholderia terrae TaxID=311230 RepID=UPI00296ACAAE|nr:hypothetical protein [Paraburkholderia terrae]MDW3657805.1 hypothetical protein [Paraburkholderia terrae]
MPKKATKVHAIAPSPFANVEKAWRFASEFDDVIIQIDVSENIKQRGSKIRSFDTRAYRLNAAGGVGNHKGIHPLMEFPHLLASLKHAANTAVKTNDGGPAQAFTDTAKITILIIDWMFRRGIERFNDLTRKHVADLSHEVAEQGWWNLLGYDYALLREAQNIVADPKRLADIARIHTGDNYMFSPANLSLAIGLPINANDIPQWFRRAVVDKKIPPRDSFDRPTRIGPNNREHLTTLMTLNRLAKLEEGFDCIRFDPFPKPQQEVEAGEKRRALASKKLRSQSVTSETKTNQEASVDGSHHTSREPVHNGNRSAMLLDNLADEIDALTAGQGEQADPPPSAHATPNMPLSIAVAGFREALKWQYDYRDAILRVLRILRKSLESEVAEKRVLARPFTEPVLAEVNTILESAGVPLKVGGASRTDSPASALVDTTMFALYFNIATNLGRRPREILGTGKSYGLYHGCCAKASEKIPFYRIETYIQKSVGDYATSWCNQLVADAVSFLEEIFQLARPLFASESRPKTSVEEARTEKLFQFPLLTQSGFESQRRQFDARQAANTFFRLAGIDPKIFFGKQMPFRRTFMTLYVHRFDSPELLALQQYMRDFSIESLLAYYRDRAHSLPEDSIKAHYAAYEAEALAIANMLKEERKLYLVEILEDLFTGRRRFGGAFARVVNALLKRFSRPETFRSAPASQKAQQVADDLEERGYQLVEGKNSICMAGDAQKTKEQSNCFDGIRLRTEEASPTRCNGCVHSNTTESHISIFEEEIEHARKTMNDKRLPMALRKEAGILVETLNEVIASERRMAEGSRALFQRFSDGWTTIRAELT